MLRKWKVRHTCRPNIVGLCRSSLLSVWNVRWPRRVLSPSESRWVCAVRSIKVRKRRDRQTDGHQTVILDLPTYVASVTSSLQRIRRWCRIVRRRTQTKWYASCRRSICRKHCGGLTRLRARTSRLLPGRGDVVTRTRKTAATGSFSTVSGTSYGRAAGTGRRTLRRVDFVVRSVLLCLSSATWTYRRASISASSWKYRSIDRSIN